MNTGVIPASYGSDRVGTFQKRYIASDCSFTDVKFVCQFLNMYMAMDANVLKDLLPSFGCALYILTTPPSLFGV